jgi:hypothetical protein
MSDFRIEIAGFSQAAATLASDLRPGIEAGALGIAAAIQDTLAPYPPAPPRIAGLSYYVRGQGSFTARGTLIRSSEMLNRRWGIKSIPLGARLRNTASYAGWVHGRQTQTRDHEITGWAREDTAISEVLSSGEAERIMGAAIATAIKAR